MTQRGKHLPAVWETWVQSLNREDPLEKEMAAHSSTLAWKIPWMEEPGGLQSMGSQSRTRLSDFTFFLSFPVSWETCMQVKKQQLEPYMEWLTGSKLGKEYIKAVYCHPAYLTYMQSTSCEMLGWMNHKMESRLLGERSANRYAVWYHFKGRKQRGTKGPLD